MEIDGNHLIAMEKVVNVLSSDPFVDHNMEAPSSSLPSDSGFSNATMELDDNMTLSHYQ